MAQMKLRKMIILTPSQLAAQAGYDILEPSFMPQNYQYDHGDLYTLGGNGVDLYYICENGDLRIGAYG